MLKIISPCEGVAPFATAAVLSAAILVVGNVGACPMPPLSRFIQLPHTEHHNLHAGPEQTIALIQIQYVKFDAMICMSIRNAKEKPLRVASCVDVVLEQQIVLVVVDLRSKGQVSTFES